MGYNSSLRGGLFIFECARFIFLMLVLTALNPGGSGDFPWPIYAVPNALFPLMLLFLWLDFPKYGMYEPLYKSGKCICVFAMLGGCFFSWRAGLTLPSGADGFQLFRVLTVLLLGDLFTVAAAVLIGHKSKAGAPAAASEHIPGGGDTIPATHPAEAASPDENEDAVQEGKLCE